MRRFFILHGKRDGIWRKMQAHWMRLWIWDFCICERKNLQRQEYFVTFAYKMKKATKELYGTYLRHKAVCYQ